MPSPSRSLCSCPTATLVIFSSSQPPASTPRLPSPPPITTTPPFPTTPPSPMNPYPRGPNLYHQIQTLLHQLRYPPELESYISRDMYQCCSQYTTLQPRIEQYNSDRAVISLYGTIPILWQGVKYQIPVAIICPPQYPNQPPVPYVRPTPAMILRPKHQNVDTSGRVHLPHYLGVWDKTQYNLHGVVVTMSRVFSVAPPVNSRPAPQQQIQPQNDPARRRLILTLSRDLHQRLQQDNDKTMETLCKLLTKEEDLCLTKDHVDGQLRSHQSLVSTSEDRHNLLHSEKSKLNTWFITVEPDNEEKHIDMRLRCRDVLDEQMIQCGSEDSAYTDVLYQVDEAFAKSLIDLDTYVKEVRRLAREQFFPRALRKKIEMSKATTEQPQQTHANGEAASSSFRRMRSTRGAPLYAA